MVDEFKIWNENSWLAAEPFGVIPHPRRQYGDDDLWDDDQNAEPSSS